MSRRTADKAVSASRPSSSSAPDTPTPMRLEITRIKAYDRNPRRSENPEYDRIEASIRAGGMDQPLVVTRRPGETAYIVGAGGNTRLHILQALYQETGDERFYWVDCLFKPWNHESDVLLAHLRENDLRSGLSFIDKARAVFDAKRLLEEETGIADISQRRLETLLRERGFGLSHGLISQMGYAVYTLFPVIPQALQSGLGRPQVERIRALDRAARGIWKKRGLGDDQGFDAVFAALCERYDGPEWDLEPLRTAIETEIAEALEVSIHAVRVELDARLLGRDIEINAPEGEDDPETCEQAGAASAAPLSSASKIAEVEATADASQGDDIEVTVGSASSDLHPHRAPSHPLPAMTRRTIRLPPRQNRRCPPSKIRSRSASRPPWTSSPCARVPGPWPRVSLNATASAGWSRRCRARDSVSFCATSPIRRWPTNWTPTRWARSPCCGGIWPPARR